MSALPAKALRRFQKRQLSDTANTTPGERFSPINQSNLCYPWKWRKMAGISEQLDRIAQLHPKVSIGQFYYQCPKRRTHAECARRFGISSHCCLYYVLIIL